MSSKQEQQLIAQAQIYQHQIQEIVSQKEALGMQELEIKRALEELQDVKDEVYKVAGPLLIKSTKEDVKKDLDEKIELIELRKKTLEKSEKRLKEQFEDLREKLSKMS